MRTSAENMALRASMARASFVRTVTELGFSHADACTIADVYVHIGVLHFDPVDGQYQIRHGGFMDRQVMDNALAGSAEALAAKAVTWHGRSRWKRK